MQGEGVAVLKIGTPEYTTQQKIRQAAARAPKVYPGPVGKLLARELHTYADMVFLWGNGGTMKLVMEVVEDVMGRET